MRNLEARFLNKKSKRGFIIHLKMVFYKKPKATLYSAVFISPVGRLLRWKCDGPDLFHFFFLYILVLKIGKY